MRWLTNYKIVTHEREQDEDELFCMSLITSFRNLDDEKKMCACIDVQQVLMSARFDNAMPPPQPIAPSATSTETHFEAN